MRIQHNIAALNAYRNLTNNNSAVSKNLEKLSSGYKINRAGDDAAGLAISEKMRAQITGLEKAQDNANDGISLVQTAEGALTEVHSMLNRMYELAEQSANGTYDNEVDRAQLQKELESLTEEINRIADSTNFNGISLLDGSMSTAATTNVPVTAVADGDQSGTAAQAGVYSFDLADYKLSLSSAGETTQTADPVEISKVNEGDDDTEASFTASLTYDSTADQTVTVSDTTFLIKAVDTSGTALAEDADSLITSGSGTADNPYVIQRAANTTDDAITSAIVAKLMENGYVTIGENEFTVEASGTSLVFTAVKPGAVEGLEDAAKSAITIAAASTEEDPETESGTTSALRDVTVTVGTAADTDNSVEAKGGTVSATLTVGDIQNGDKITIAGTIYTFSSETEPEEGAAENTIYYDDYSSASTLATTLSALDVDGYSINATAAEDGSSVEITLTEDTTTVNWEPVDETTLKAALSYTPATSESGNNEDEVALTAADDDSETADVKVTIGSKDVTLAFAEGYDKDSTIDGEELAAAILEGTKGTFTDSKGITYNVTVEGSKVTLTQQAAPTGSSDTPGNLAISVTDSGNNSWDQAVHVETAASTSSGNAVAQGKFELTGAIVTDGGTLRIGDTTYTFKVGANSSVSGSNVIDLSSYTDNGSDELLVAAAQKLSENGASNSLFDISSDNESAFVYLTEKLGTEDNRLVNYQTDWDLKNTDDNTTDALWNEAASAGTRTLGVVSYGGGNGLTLQIGDTADSYNKLTVSINDCHSDSMGIGSIDISTQDGAASALTKIKSAINYVSDVRGTLGAVQNRLEHTINNLSVTTENITAAESRIRDVDMAEEMMAYTKNNILVQASQAMLAQANQIPQGVLQLLQ